MRFFASVGGAMGVMRVLSDWWMTGGWLLVLCAIRDVGLKCNS